MTSPKTRERLLIVSNRLPLTARRVSGRWRSERSSGGLIAAMAPLMRELDGLWFGWSGESRTGEGPGLDSLIREWEAKHRYVAVEIPARISRAFYEGYANDTLWPLFHGLVSRVTFDPAFWHAYRDANERFAAAVVERLKPGDLIWVQDYQLLLVPQLIREARPDARIGFFLHIPFPASEAFRVLPQREEILRGMLGADEIAFQTHGHLHDFRRSLLQVLGLESRMDRVLPEGRSVRLEALPIGIATEEWVALSQQRDVRRRIDELRARHAGRQLIVSVDRLDYTKGIPERLKTFRRLLRGSPEWRSKVTLIQVAVPSRERVPAYAELRREVAELVGEVNGDVGTPEWQPIVYLRRSVARSELAALYGAADVCWVGPLRDGMNLVAKEFVASQRERDGILVLSEFAGAAQELGEALRINPYDEEGTASVITRALEMPPDRRRERMNAMFDRIRRDDAVAWSERFLSSLRAITAEDRRDAATERPEPDPRRLVAAFEGAPERLLLLDYDGTLVPLTQRPADAVPDGALVDLLRRLTASPGTTVAILSGRPRSDIDRWFGDIPRLWVAAEHGALLRAPGEEWQPLRSGADTEWKGRVRPLLEQFSRSAPGSFVEEKEFSLGWHYRLADPEFGSWIANELVNTLDQMLAGTELSVLRGHKVIEVHFAWANKGEVAASLLPRSTRGRFILAIGDDRTDEDMFARLPKTAWVVRVGRGTTRARFSVRDPATARGLLGLLADVGSGGTAAPAAPAAPAARPAVVREAG